MLGTFVCLCVCVIYAILPFQERHKSIFAVHRYPKNDFVAATVCLPCGLSLHEVGDHGSP